MPKKKNWRPEDGDITHLIERLEAFEERVGVRLDALFASVEADFHCFTVRGEVHSREGMTIKKDITVHVGAYDSSGRLVAEGKDYFYAEDFFGFATFRVCEAVPGQELSKIRVYPQVN